MSRNGELDRHIDQADSLVNEGPISLRAQVLTEGVGRTECDALGDPHPRSAPDPEDGPGSFYPDPFMLLMIAKIGRLHACPLFLFGLLSWAGVVVWAASARREIVAGW